MAKKVTKFNPQKVTFRGNVGRLEELKKAGEEMVLNFSLRCPVLTAVIDDQGVQVELNDSSGFWVEANCWGKLAEQASKLLRVGANIAIAGKMSVDSYISQKEKTEGHEKQTIKVKAYDVYLVPFGVEEVAFKSSKNKSDQEVNVHLAKPEEA